jgi:membrane protease YdiL (CAAX protease family)
MLKFFALTYAATWTCFGAVALVSRETESAVAGWTDFRMPLLLLGTIAPSLVAIALVARERGADGVQALLRRMLEWRVAAQWYVFAIGYMLALKLAAAVLHRAIAGDWPAFGTTPWLTIALAIVFVTPLQAGEEIGWRGYALPRLAAKLGLGRASVLLGLIVGAWHLPLFLTPGLGNYGQSFPLFVLGSTGLSVAIAWLYANTRGSLLLAMLMHSAVNQTIGVVPTRLAVPADNPLTAIDTSLITLIFGALLIVSAIYFIVRMSRLGEAP